MKLMCAFVFLFAMMVLTGSEGFAAACKFKVNSTNSWVSGTSLSAVFNLGDVPGVGGLQSEIACRQKGQDFFPMLSRPPIEAAACASAVKDGWPIYGLSRAGLTGSVSVIVGTVNRNPAVYSCPAGFTLNGSFCRAEKVGSASGSQGCPSGLIQVLGKIGFCQRPATLVRPASCSVQFF